jgi:hypothetical protein
MGPVSTIPNQERKKMSEPQRMVSSEIASAGSMIPAPHGEYFVVSVSWSLAEEGGNEEILVEQYPVVGFLWTQAVEYRKRANSGEYYGPASHRDARERGFASRPSLSPLKVVYVGHDCSGIGFDLCVLGDENYSQTAFYLAIKSELGKVISEAKKEAEIVLAAEKEKRLQPAQA